MLKWFRKYNKFILVVGCAVLMVAFLIPQAVSMFSPRPGDQVIAEVHGEDVTRNDLANAGIRLEILQRMGLEALAPYKREQWFLMLRDADAAGLGASDVEITQALAGMGIDPSTDDLDTLASRFGQQPAVIRSVIHDLLVAERYRLLATGHRFDSTAATLSSSPGLVSISMLSGFQRDLQTPQAQQLGPAFARYAQFQFFNALEGTGRLSPPFVTAVLFDEAERVSGSLAVIEPEVTDAVRDAVTDEDLERLFTEYSGFLPGSGSPYPFGYRVPDRVKLEALSVSTSAVRATLQVETVDVLEAFRAENPGGTPTPEEREAVRDRLLGQATDAKMREIGSQIRGEVESARRGIDTDVDGRLELEGTSYQPPALGTLADDIEASHGVRPTILQYTDEFLTAEEASSLDGLRLAGLPDLQVGFGLLLGKLPEFRSEEAEVDVNEIPVPVQVGVAMPLLTSLQDGSLFLVRVTAADPAHEPASMEDVRAEVSADAALVAAYEDLLARKAEFITEAVASGLESLPTAGTVIDVPAFPQRTRRNSDTGSPVAPTLPEVGRAPALVDAAFGAIKGLGPADGVDKLSDADRVVAAGVDGRLVLGVMRVDELERPTRSDLFQSIASGVLTGLDQTFVTESVTSPIAEDALRERLDFSNDL